MPLGIVVAGTTLSADFPVTRGAIQRSLNGKTDAFIGWLDAETGVLQDATFLGGSATDVASGVAITPNGQVLVTGFCNSQDFPVTTPRPAAQRSTFLARLTRTRSDTLIRFTRFQLNPLGGLDLQVQAPAGITYRLETSFNLQDWSLLTEFNTATGSFDFTQPRQAGGELRTIGRKP